MPDINRSPHQELDSLTDPSKMINSICISAQTPELVIPETRLTSSCSLPQGTSTCLSDLFPSSTSLESLPGPFLQPPRGCLSPVFPSFSLPQLYPTCNCIMGLCWTYGPAFTAPCPPPTLTLASPCSNSLHLCILIPPSVPLFHVKLVVKRLEVAVVYKPPGLTPLPAATSRLFP